MHYLFEYNYIRINLSIILRPFENGMWVEEIIQNIGIRAVGTVSAFELSRQYQKSFPPA